MQELEKILEEIKSLAVYSETKYGYGAMCVPVGAIERIIRMHMSGKDTGVPTNDGWIPVEERDHLPEAGEHVLVSIGTGFNLEKAFLSEDGHWTMLHAPEGYNDITDMVDAWRPLPEPYRPTKEFEGSRRLREREEFFKE